MKVLYQVYTIPAPTFRDNMICFVYQIGMMIPPLLRDQSADIQMSPEFMNHWKTTYMNSEPVYAAPIEIVFFYVTKLLLGFHVIAIICNINTQEVKQTWFSIKKKSQNLT